MLSHVTLDKLGQIIISAKRTVTIWIPNTWIPDSSEYPTLLLSVNQKVKSCDGWPFKYWTFFDHNQTFFSLVFRPPFENLMHIYQLNTRLVQYSDAFWFRKIISIWFIIRFQKLKSIKFYGLNGFDLETWRVNLIELFCLKELLIFHV